ncbi:hypothetical protein N7520_001509 [Penicillium odoratum]|uniref:uncharacterized protein n=1 Tax=Penicillium odoratum TaxID=1167516 RepID=UPI00254840AF|nr:uncharacterized protein N7520_001509 [Penicillium odoratum]KAJ5778263.1 hypothetical protein N7520_001509 [Penicillium odoratum]
MTRGFATITPECEVIFDAVKETDKLNYVIYEASAHDKKISVAESGKYEDYADFLSHFKDDTPRYAVVELQYDFPGGDKPRHKLAFITWVPEGTGIHDRSYYTTNKDHLFRALSDISLHVQAATQEDLAHAKILSQFKAL